MLSRKILLILILCIMPMQAQAATKEYRACISKAVLERKDSLKKIKESRNTFLVGHEKNIKNLLAKESRQYEADLNVLKKKRGSEIKDSMFLDEKKGKLDKIKSNYFASYEKLQAKKEQRIGEIQKQRRDTINDVAVKYKKFKTEIWRTFVNNKNQCVKS